MPLKLTNIREPMSGRCSSMGPSARVIDPSTTAETRKHAPARAPRRSGTSTFRRTGATPLRARAFIMGPFSRTEYPLDLSHHLFGRERLGDVIVGAHGHPLLALDVAALSREHDDADAGPAWICPDSLADVEAVALGHHGVEQDQVRLSLGDLI